MESIQHTGDAQRAPSSAPGLPDTALATICVVCAGILIYVFGTFRLAEIFGLKRVLEALLLLPVLLGAFAYIAPRLRILRSPLIAFAVVKLVMEVVWRRDFLYLAEGSAVIAALSVVYFAPARSVRTGARVVVWTAACFATMGLVQWITLFVAPELGVHRLVAGDDGQIVGSLDHPIVLLGLFSRQDWTFLGHPVARFQSFAREPSLNLVYFFIPASLALYMNTKPSKWAFCVLLLFSVFSFSGSVLLSLAFAACWWLLSILVGIRFVLPFGMLFVTALYLYSVMVAGVGPLLTASAQLAKVNGLFLRTRSISDRALPAIDHFRIALTSPLGSRVLTDASGPLLISATLASGWLGVILLTTFLRRLGRRVEYRFEEYGSVVSNKVATFLLLGGLTTIMVFSDYAMTSYAGLILLMFLYRVVETESVVGVVSLRRTDE